MIKNYGLSLFDPSHVQIAKGREGSWSPVISGCLAFFPVAAFGKITGGYAITRCPRCAWFFVRREARTEKSLLMENTQRFDAGNTIDKPRAWGFITTILNTSSKTWLEISRNLRLWLLLNPEFSRDFVDMPWRRHKMHETTHWLRCQKGYVYVIP